jgi:hypothetical protein
VITHACGSVIPPDIEKYVRHLASCPETWGVAAGVCQGIVSSVGYEHAHGETGETPTETRDLTPAEMADMWRDGEPGGVSLRDIGAIAGVAPETVRRRIAKWKRENGL